MSCSIKMQKILSLTLRITGMVYIAILFVIDVILLPINQQAIEALIDNIRYVFLYYSCIAFLHCYIRYGVGMKDKNLLKIPDVAKRTIAVLFVWGLFWMWAVGFVSEAMCRLFADCSSFLIWLCDAMYFVPFVLPFKSRNSDSECCGTSMMVIGSILIMILIICVACTLSNCLQALRN